MLPQADSRAQKVAVPRRAQNPQRRVRSTGRRGLCEDDGGGAGQSALSLLFPMHSVQPRLCLVAQQRQRQAQRRQCFRNVHHDPQAPHRVARAQQVQRVPIALRHVLLLCHTCAQRPAAPKKSVQSLRQRARKGCWGWNGHKKVEKQCALLHRAVRGARRLAPKGRRKRAPAAG